MLRLGVALVAVDSKSIASHCRRQYFCLRSWQAPGIIMYSDPVLNESCLEPTPSVASQSRSLSVIHLLHRCRRQGRCSKQILCEQRNIENDQYI